MKHRKREQRKGEEFLELPSIANPRFFQINQTWKQITYPTPTQVKN
jgi:hypothetical protein